MRAVGIGAGGHAKVLLEALLAQGDVEVVGLLDSDPELKGSKVLGVPVLGGDELLEQLHKDGVRHAFMGVGGIGDNSMRSRLFEWVKKSGFELISVRHATAVVSPSSHIGEGTCLCPGAIVGAGARLGLNVIVNTGAIVEHDCDLGDHVHVASGAVLAGGVSVGAGAHIGAGATVRQGVRIGRNAIVAMGAAVVDDVPDDIVVAGVPARPMQAKAKA
jgi:sugar O-acyltransferase (sialic acid O-acetyltransferase NeuD family)